jgi:hypothetical protein
MNTKPHQLSGIFRLTLFRVRRAVLFSIPVTQSLCLLIAQDQTVNGSLDLIQGPLTQRTPHVLDLLGEGGAATGLLATLQDTSISREYTTCLV